jgi:hypothetical protein
VCFKKFDDVIFVNEPSEVSSSVFVFVFAMRSVGLVFVCVCVSVFAEQSGAGAARVQLLDHWAPGPGVLLPVQVSKLAVCALHGLTA